MIKNENLDYNAIKKYFNQGLLYLEQSNWDGALEQFNQVVQLYPSAAAYNNLGAVYLKKGQALDAIKQFSNALRVDENNVEARSNLAIILLEQHHYSQASYHYEELLKLTPDDKDARYNLGVALMAQGRKEEAIACFEMLSEHQNVQYLLHALKGDTVPPEAPKAHIQPLFDNYASRFDEHMLRGLQYQTPERLLEVVKDNIKISCRILDLGCGTGLSGAVFRSYASYLAGVDLSSKMLEIARQKNIYDELIEADIVSALQSIQQPYDLIIAADVFVYMGDLSPVFKACHSKGCYFVFSTEITENGDYQLNETARYSHNKTYIARLAQETNFELIICKKAILRQQNDQPVEGYLFVLRGL